MQSLRKGARGNAKVNVVRGLLFGKVRRSWCNQQWQLQARAKQRRAGALTSGNSEPRSNKERDGARRTGALSSGNSDRGPSKRRAGAFSSETSPQATITIIREVVQDPREIALRECRVV